MEENGIKKQNPGYIGDDLNDYTAMQYAGFVTCPSDAYEEVRNISSYISAVKGGQGVIEDGVYDKDYDSYCSLVSWETFTADIDKYVDIAAWKKDNRDHCDIEKCL